MWRRKVNEAKGVGCGRALLVQEHWRNGKNGGLEGTVEKQEEDFTCLHAQDRKKVGETKGPHHLRGMQKAEENVQKRSQYSEGFSREPKGRVERFERLRQVRERVIKERGRGVEWAGMLGYSGQLRQAGYAVERV